MKLKAESNQKTLLKNRLPPVLNALSLLAMPGSIQSRLWDAVIATARARLCHTQQGRTPAATSPQPLQRVAPCCSVLHRVAPGIFLRRPPQHLTLLNIWKDELHEFLTQGIVALLVDPTENSRSNQNRTFPDEMRGGVHNLPVDNQPLTTSRSGRPSGFQFGPEPCFKMPAARRVACPSEPNPSNR